MSHHIYTTPAIVLESLPGREADRRYTLFTREFGIIRATATGVRRSTSKLRYALQDFSLPSVSLVKGKEYWRITNAAAGENIFWRERTNITALEAVGRIFRLLIRMVPGEEKNEALHDHITEALTFSVSHALSEKDTKAFEQVLVLRILYDLGYGSQDAKLAAFLMESWTQELLVAATNNRQSILAAINFSLHQSQL